MKMIADLHGMLGAELSAMAGAALLRSQESRWASSGFSGARHSFVLELPPTSGPLPYSDIERHEFRLPGHIVADIALVERAWDRQGCQVTIEALTVED